MRKQTDFDIRVFDIVAGSNVTEGGMSHDQVRDFVKENYLDRGWEVIGVENTQISANHAFFAVYLAKYEDTSAPSVVPQAEAIKRGPGRPPKSETE